MRVRAVGVAAALLAAVAAQLSVAAPSPATTPTPLCGSMAGLTPHITKVMWIMMENLSYGTGINTIPGAPNPSAPYTDATLLAQCGSTSNYHAASHPSFPNYLAVTSGSTQGQNSDHLGYFAVPSIFSQADPSWRSYEEFMPSNCDHYYQTGDSTTHQYYLGRHNPASDYSALPVGAPSTGDCATNDVPLGSTSSGALLTDVQGGTLPSFSMVTPGLCDDMHNFPTTDPGCPDPILGGDNWLASWIPIITAGSDYAAGNLVIDVVWDEGRSASGITPVPLGGDCTVSSTPDCIVPNVVISPYTTHLVSSTDYSHYSLLRTTEHLLGLSYLGHAGDVTTNDMCGDFGLCATQPGPPTARFTSTCTQLTCAFDGSGSTATSGGIASYGWDFGDGSAGTGATPTHTYAGAGSDSVTLTVTDGLGATGSLTQTVSPSTTTSVSFLASVSATGRALQQTLTVPGVAAGDEMLLFGTAAGTTALLGPAGWQQVGTVTAKGSVSTVWSRVATSADAGQPVTVGMGTTRREAVQLLAYAGTSATAPVLAFASLATGATASVTTPTLTLPSPGWVVSYWAAKSTYITAWTVPAGQIVRSAANGTGGGHINAVATDSGAPSPAGPAGGLTATATVAQGSGAAWTIALAPGP